MPAYNSRAHIADAIRSVVAQTYDAWELVVVNDGSTDDTAAIVAGLGLPSGRLSYLETANAGVGAARNRAIERATGALVAFLDADDIWEPAKLERQVEVMRDGDFDVVFSDYHLIGEAARRADEVPSGAYRAQEMFRLLFERNSVPLISVMARREAVIAAGMFLESGDLARYGEDYELWLRMADGGSAFFAMPDRLVRYRPHRDLEAHRPLVTRLDTDLRVVLRFADRMAALDAAGCRSRIAGLYNLVAAARAGAGDIAGARRALAELGAFEPLWRVRVKTALLLLLRRRYAAWYGRLLRRG